jgi:hypothetical protein
VNIGAGRLDAAMKDLASFLDHADRLDVDALNLAVKVVDSPPFGQAMGPIISTLGLRTNLPTMNNVIKLVLFFVAELKKLDAELKKHEMRKVGS